MAQRLRQGDVMSPMHIEVPMHQRKLACDIFGPDLCAVGAQAVQCQAFVFRGEHDEDVEDQPQGVELIFLSGTIRRASLAPLPVEDHAGQTVPALLPVHLHEH